MAKKLINLATVLQWIKWGPPIGFSAADLSIRHSAHSDLIKLSEVGKFVQGEK